MGIFRNGRLHDVMIFPVFMAFSLLNPLAIAAGKAKKSSVSSAKKIQEEESAAPVAETVTADVILKKADEIRNPSSSYKMEVSVESTNDPTFKFEINIGGKDSSLIRTLEPSREVGKNYLMLQENMWAYIPNIKRSIRVTLNQKLTGQASNGDISRMRWYGDYDPKIESETPDQWILFLTARRTGLTYEKIRVFIDKKTFKSQHGEYLTTQGKVLKTIDFVEYSALAGAIRPTKMVLKNAQKESEQSTLRILKMAEATFPSNFFSEGNLP